jgi:hypothetical protein
MFLGIASGLFIIGRNNRKALQDVPDKQKHQVAARTIQYTLFLSIPSIKALFFHPFPLKFLLPKTQIWGNSPK